MSNQLTQEEIDAMLSGGAMASDEPEQIEDPLSQDIKDIIGEVGNISMSQAATTLSQLLNRKVSITTPVKPSLKRFGLRTVSTIAVL